MNIEKFREQCLSIKGSTESFSFIDKSILVFKIMDKMFAYIALESKDGIFRANLKYNAQRSVELRERYNGIAQTDFKTLLWNQLTIESDVPDQLICELIQHSVDEVIKKLSKTKRKEYLGDDFDIRY